MNVAFLINDLQLSGGIGVVVEHGRQLSDRLGWDVSLVLVREQETPDWGYEQLADLRVISLAEAQQRHYEVAVATWWETTFSLFTVPAERYAYFVQSLEDRFYLHDEPERIGAALTLDLPVAFITEARWIEQTLSALRPDAPCYLVRNGIDKEIFRIPEQLEVHRQQPLRVVVEGNPRVWFKHVPESIEATRRMREPRHLTVVTSEHAAVAGDGVDEVVGPLTKEGMAELYGRSDVVLKLSSVEGMFGPPLEGFHRGATCVVTPVTGHDEYVEHRWNGLVCDWDDLSGTARQLDLLAADRRMLNFLRTNAVATARGWPSWEQASQFMAAALAAIAAGPPPAPTAGAHRLLSDLRAGVEAYRVHLLERNEYARQVQRLDRIRTNRIVAAVWGARRRPGIRHLLKPMRPLWLRIRSRILS